MLNHTRILLWFKNICASFLLFAIILGCSSNKDTRVQDLNAVKGIAFLIIEANYGNPENEDAINEGITYSRYWLSKQSPERLKKLEELSYILSALIIDLNIGFLEQMTNQSENIEGKIDNSQKRLFEKAISEEEGFNIEWQKHKGELTEGMSEQINEFQEKIKINKQKEQILLKTREVYTKSQPVLRQLMEERIKEIFRT
jgi:hypothetical protein